MIIKCPECGKDVSSEAHACPFCGYPIKNNDLKTNESIIASNEKEIERMTEEAKYYNSTLAFAVIFGLIFLLGGILLYTVGGLVFNVEGLPFAGIVIAPIGFLYLVIGGSVGNTKYNNRIKRINDLKSQNEKIKSSNQGEQL